MYYLYYYGRKFFSYIRYQNQQQTESLKENQRILLESVPEKLHQSLKPTGLEDDTSCTLKALEYAHLALEYWCEQLLPNDEAHRPRVTVTKGGLQATRVVTMTTLCTLGLTNPLLTLAITSIITFLSAIKAYRHAEKRLNNFEFWLKDSLSQWIQLEKNILVLSDTIEQKKAGLNVDATISQPLFYAVLKKQTERLARRKLDSFILKKDITYAIAHHVFNNKNNKEIQEILNNLSQLLIDKRHLKITPR